MIPRNLSAEQRDLLERLSRDARRATTSEAADAEGLFAKVKRAFR